MIRRLILFAFSLVLFLAIAPAQSFIKASDLFRRADDNYRAGKLTINQDPAIDTLISRYILINKNLKEKNGYYGMEGCRIQIYRSNNRNAKKESSNAGAEFVSKFPGIVSHALFAEPGYYIIQVGDFRTKTEATRLFLLISKVFPNAYIVPKCFINFPDQNTK